MQKILCVCFGNTCRSPMLAALLRKELDARGVEAIVESAGLNGKRGEPAADDAIIVMTARGLDVNQHRSRQVADLDLSSYDRLLVVEESLVPHLLALGAASEKMEVVNWERGGIPNPWTKGLAAYLECADLLSEAVADLGTRIGEN